MRDHEPVTLSEFMGTFDRGEDDVCPPDHFLNSQNIVFTEKGVETRNGTRVDIALPDIRRIASYKRIGEADRLIILDSSGRLWDSTNTTVPILTISTMSDFSMVSLYNRAYITPHNSVRGLPGQKVYVYEGSGAARPAGGTKPTGSSLVVSTSTSVGSIEIGKHLFAVAYETSSGFLTQPGPEVFTLYNAPGAKKANISNVLIGPPGTVARYILATKTLATDYAGDATNQQFFFVPNGRIGDNASTTIEVNFFDADLGNSSDYLLNQLETLPAGVGIGVYGNRLTLWGIDTAESAVYFSLPGDPESISADEGFLLAFPGDAGGGVRNCVEFRSQYYIQKAQRTYVTNATDDNAAFWSVTAVDQSLGTECHGIAKILDLSGSTSDNFLTCDRSGLYLFNGTFANNNLSYKYDDVWARINRNAFNQVEIVFDPVRALIYIAVPLDSAIRPSHVLVADVMNGMDGENIRWTHWTFPKEPTTIVVDVRSSDRKTVFKFGSDQGDVHVYDDTIYNDFGNAYESFIETALLPPDNNEVDSVIYHFSAIRARVEGQGSMSIQISGIDRAKTQNPTGFTLSMSPGRTLDRLLNFQDERASIKFSVSDYDSFFIFIRMKLFARILWAAREYI